MSGSIRQSGLTLGLYVIAAGLLIAGVFALTQQRIDQSRRDLLTTSLSALLPGQGYNNVPIDDVIFIYNDQLDLKKPLPAYRARQGGEPTAIVLTLVTPDGYNGNITLLLGLTYSGVIIGARIISHRETPGLGDDIDIRRSNWIDSFNGLSLSSTDKSAWQVKNHGGKFDQFTGATITPRAVIRAIHGALQWYAEKRQQLYDLPANSNLFIRS